MAQYLPILCMIIVVGLFASGSFIASQLFAPHRQTKAKTAPYECGIVPEVEPAERFPVKFYLVAMIFIILDVEIIFLYPFVIVFRDLGAYGLGAMGIFLLTLLVPFGYLLSTGALDWGSLAKTPLDVGHRVLRSSGGESFELASDATHPGPTPAGPGREDEAA